MPSAVPCPVPRGLARVAAAPAKGPARPQPLTQVSQGLLHPSPSKGTLPTHPTSPKPPWSQPPLEFSIYGLVRVSFTNLNLGFPLR